MQFVIERAKACDAEAILAHLNIVGRETDNLTFGAEGFPMSAEQERELLAAQENAENWAMLVAKAEGQIIGLANFRGLPRERMKHRGEMAISVCRAAWGQGVGSALMEAVIRFARENAHAEIISLEVRSDNARAIRLYERFGFVKIGHYPGFFKIDGQYVDFDLMNLYL